MLFRTIKNILISATILLALLPAGNAYSISNNTIGVAPALVAVKVKKGQVYTYPFTVFNDSSAPMKIKACFQDFQLNTEGNVIFIPGAAGKKSWSAASWLALSDKEFILGAGKEKNILLFIAPSRQAEAGTHRTLVTFTTISPRSEKNNKSQLSIKAGVSSVILIDVGGKTTIKPTIKVNVPYINFTCPRINIALGNKGNIHYFAKGTVSLINSNKKILHKIDLKKQPPGVLILPKAERLLEFNWAGAPYLGFYSARVSANITGNRKLQANKTFFIIRWQLFAALGLLLASCFAVYYVLSNFRFVRKE